MGAGKSTIGKRLARMLELPFADVDQAIETQAGISIPDIFMIKGEAAFREMEYTVIEDFLTHTLGVLATGGGAFCQAKTRELIKKSAISVWLKADLDILLERVKRTGHRPLLQHGDKRAIMQKLMEERYPIYAEANLTIDSNASNHDSVVKNIVKTIQQHLAGT